MTIRTVTRNGRNWAWPEYDTELIKVFDQVEDIGRILPYVQSFNVCVQAGGACGVWPAKLCEYFDLVYTFEPDAINRACIAKNAPSALLFHGALGAAPGLTGLHRHPSEATNCGAGYVAGDGDVPVLTIDEVVRGAVGLILLDVEGAEADALWGARSILEMDQPVVVIEEKPLPQGGDHLAARRFLEHMGYQERARFHRDVLFTC